MSLFLTALVAVGAVVFIVSVFGVGKIRGRAKARINDAKVALEDSLGDVVDDRVEAITTRENELRNVQREAAQLGAEISMLRDKHEKEEADVQKYDALATRAGAAGNREAARQALEYRNAARTRAEALVTQVEALEETFETLQKELDKEKGTVEAAKSQLAQFKARATSLKMRERAHATLAGLGNSNLDFSAQDDELARREAALQADKKLSGGEDGVGSALAAFIDSEGSTSVDAELDALLAPKPTKIASDNTDELGNIVS